MVFFSEGPEGSSKGITPSSSSPTGKSLMIRFIKPSPPLVPLRRGQVQADSGEHLNRLLRENHRNVFTLIRSSEPRRGARNSPTAPNLIVMTDEAHCSQYDVFTEEQGGPPHSAFIGFTGTPLMAGEETKEVFGTTSASTTSGSPWRMVQLCLSIQKIAFPNFNKALNEDLNRVIEAMLDERQGRSFRGSTAVPVDHS